MPFDFDTVIDRRPTDSSKWGPARDRDVIPLPVADMDFRSPDEVIQAIHARVDHGVFGYPEPQVSLTEAVIEMLAREHDWDVEPDWLVWLNGLVVGLNLFARTLPEGAGVATVTPIYPPFLLAQDYTGRKLLKIPLLTAEDHYAMDFEAMEAAFASPECHAFFLSNPHNPSGRVYSRDALARLAKLAEKHGVLICSDEVHCDLILDADRKHIPFAALSDDAASRSITLMSPSKTYNLAGLKCAFAIIPDAKLREQYRRAARGIVTELNILGMVACEAAYRFGKPWHDAVRIYLRGNRDMVHEAVRDIPGLSCHHIEATYLAWIDCRDKGIKDPYQHFLDRGLMLSDGRYFDGTGFVRLNFGCPRATLKAALERLAL